MFASLSIHIFKDSDCFPERANLYATAMRIHHSQYFTQVRMRWPRQESLLSRTQHYELHYASKHQQSFCRKPTPTSSEHINSATNQTHYRSPPLCLSHLSTLLQIAINAALQRNGLLTQFRNRAEEPFVFHQNMDYEIFLAGFAFDSRNGEKP